MSTTILPATNRNSNPRLRMENSELRKEILCLKRKVAELESQLEIAARIAPLTAGEDRTSFSELRVTLR